MDYGDSFGDNALDHALRVVVIGPRWQDLRVRVSGAVAEDGGVCKWSEADDVGVEWRLVTQGCWQSDRQDQRCLESRRRR